ncbi:MAG: S8 family serine peptidase [Eubacteriales bacterium]|nr:S8 family serine peptidase [Eubacteriales bacterium]
MEHTGRIRWYIGDEDHQTIMVRQQETLWIGSHPDCDIFLQETGVAPYHVGISYDEEKGGYWLLCESEESIVYLYDGSTLPIGEEYFLACGTEIYLGETAHAFLLEEENMQQSSQTETHIKSKHTLVKAVGAVCVAGLVFGAAFGMLHGRQLENAEIDIASTEKSSGIIKDENSDEEPWVWDGELVKIGEDSAVYRPGTNEIAFDEKERLVYYNDIIFAYLLNNPTDQECEKMAQSVGGEVVGYNSDNSLMQIKIPSTTLAEINELSNRLIQNDYVFYAKYDSPILTDFSETKDENPWSEEGKTIKGKGDLNNNPDGNDWWAEAIHAYTAWNEYEQYANEIKVAVIDNGFQLDHEELAGNIEMLNENSIEYGAHDEGHGTAVASVIAAKNNRVGLRGVADKAKLYAIDWNHNGKSLIGPGCEFVILMQQAIKQGAKVVNMSFERGPQQKDKFYNYDYFKVIADNFTNDYEYAMTNYFRNVQESALECALSMLHLYLQGQSDYILVQAAGNNGNFMKLPNNYTSMTDWTGFFASFDESNFNKLMYTRLKGISEKTRELIKDVDYRFFKDRILIVGAVEKKSKKEYLDYPMTQFSTYGTTVDICAPGKDIFCASTKKKGYETMKGTSLAAPMVTGAAAFIWSMDPSMDPKTVKNYLLKTKTYGVASLSTDTFGPYRMLDLGMAAKAVYEERVKPKEDDSVKKQLGEKTEIETENAPEILIITEAESEVSSESETDQPTLPSNDPFREYLRNVLVPQYGVIDTTTLQSPLSSGCLKTGECPWTANDVNGLLSATIRDFDHDGYDEMLVVLFYSKDGEGTDLGLQMYEYIAYSYEVTMAAERRLRNINGRYFPETGIGVGQTGVFTYEYDGNDYIAVDSNIVENGSGTTLSVFGYIGIDSNNTQTASENDGTYQGHGTGTATQLYYAFGAGYHQPGNGDRVVYSADATWARDGRRSEGPGDPLMCFGEYSEDWTILREYHPDVYDEATGTYIDEPALTQEAAEEYMEAYRSRIREMGLENNDTRLGIAPYECWTEEYKQKHTTTPQIYQALSGDIEYISGMYSYTINDTYSEVELQRCDYQGTLDEFR